MDRDTIKTIIANKQDIRRNLWNAFIILTGAIGTIILNMQNILGLLILIISVIGEAVLIYSITTINSTIEKHINILQQLKEEDKK